MFCSRGLAILLLNLACFGKFIARHHRLLSSVSCENLLLALILLSKRVVWLLGFFIYCGTWKYNKLIANAGVRRRAVAHNNVLFFFKTDHLANSTFVPLVHLGILKFHIFIVALSLSIWRFHTRWHFSASLCIFIGSNGDLWLFKLFLHRIALVLFLHSNLYFPHFLLVRLSCALFILIWAFKALVICFYRNFIVVVSLPCYFLHIKI